MGIGWLQVICDVLIFCFSEGQTCKSRNDLTNVKMHFYIPLFFDQHSSSEEFQLKLLLRGWKLGQQQTVSLVTFLFSCWYYSLFLWFELEPRVNIFRASGRHCQNVLQSFLQQTAPQLSARHILTYIWHIELKPIIRQTKPIFALYFHAWPTIIMQDNLLHWSSINLMHNIA